MPVAEPMPEGFAMREKTGAGKSRRTPAPVRSAFDTAEKDRLFFVLLSVMLFEIARDFRCFGCLVARGRSGQPSRGGSCAGSVVAVPVLQGTRIIALNGVPPVVDQLESDRIVVAVSADINLAGYGRSLIVSQVVVPCAEVVAPAALAHIGMIRYFFFRYDIAAFRNFGRIMRVGE